jgi:hypothetical protein
VLVRSRTNGGATFSGSITTVSSTRGRSICRPTKLVKGSSKAGSPPVNDWQRGRTSITSVCYGGGPAVCAIGQRSFDRLRPRTLGNVSCTFRAGRAHGALKIVPLIEMWSTKSTRPAPPTNRSRCKADARSLRSSVSFGAPSYL